MFFLSISALDKKIFEGEAESLTLPGVDGELTILKGHIPLVTSLKDGELRLKSSKKEEKFSNRGGVLQVAPQKVIVLVNI